MSYPKVLYGIILSLILSFSYCKTTNRKTIINDSATKELNLNKGGSHFVMDSLLQDKIKRGNYLFIKNCASCHDVLLRDDLIGPALHGVNFRWSDLPKKDLYNWIKNSQSLVSERHPRALELWDKWKPLIMPNFERLSDEDIELILIFIENS